MSKPEKKYSFNSKVQRNYLSLHGASEHSGMQVHLSTFNLNEEVADSSECGCNNWQESTHCGKEKSNLNP
jgi:hypothetical protein